jgi:hypothetical protein
MGSSVPTTRWILAALALDAGGTSLLLAFVLASSGPDAAYLLGIGAVAVSGVAAAAIAIAMALASGGRAPGVILRVGLVYNTAGCLAVIAAARLASAGTLTIELTALGLLIAGDALTIVYVLLVGTITSRAHPHTVRVPR